jgi:hypothetical protein
MVRAVAVDADGGPVNRILQPIFLDPELNEYGGESLLAHQIGFDPVADALPVTT